MAEKKTDTKDLTKLTYAQLEEEATKVLNALSDPSLPLDDATLLYEQGKKISSEMETRLSTLEKSLTDTKA